MNSLKIDGNYDSSDRLVHVGYGKTGMDNTVYGFPYMSNEIDRIDRFLSDYEVCKDLENRWDRLEQLLERASGCVFEVKLRDVAEFVLKYGWGKTTYAESVIADQSRKLHDGMSLFDSICSAIFDDRSRYCLELMC
jgi:hypothetical protein